MEIIIKGSTLLTPQERILAVEAAVEAICREAGQDPADTTMVLLTAAVHMANKYSGKPVSDYAVVLAEALGNAIIAADDFFKLRRTAEPKAGQSKDAEGA